MPEWNLKDQRVVLAATVPLKELLEAALQKQAHPDSRVRVVFLNGATPGDAVALEDVQLHVDWVETIGDLKVLFPSETEH